jgi:ribosomal protein L31E
VGQRENSSHLGRKAKKLFRRLISKVAERQFVYEAVMVSERVLKEIWDNPQDAEYDKL